MASTIEKGRSGCTRRLGGRSCGRDGVRVRHIEIGVLKNIDESTSV